MIMRPADKTRKVFSYLRVLASVALLARNGSSKLNFFKKASKKNYQFQPLKETGKMIFYLSLVLF